MKLDKKQRPHHVDHAVKTGNIEQLRISGRKGAEVTNRKKDEQREAETFWRERQVSRESNEAARRAEETREHIVPIEPDKEVE